MEIAATPVPFITQEEKYKDLGYGYLSDLIMAAAEAGHLELRIKFYPIKRALYEFAHDNIAFSVGNPTFASNSNLDMSEIGYLPLIKVRFFLYYYKPNQPQGISYEQLEELREYRISIRSGTTTESMYENKKMDVLKYNDPNSGFDMLKTGRVDLIEAADVLAAQVLLKDFNEEIDNFTHVEKPTNVFETGILYKKSDEESLKTINSFMRGFELIKESGKLREILNGYFGSQFQDILADQK